MNTCYIFGAMPIDKLHLKLDKSDCVIAADLGYSTLKKFNIIPNYTVGDFDSLKYTPQGENVIKHPVEKDETDTILAVDIGFKKGYKNFKLYGCLGGRLDHTIANIQTAKYIAEKGGNATICNDTISLTVIKNSEIKFTDSPDGIFSVFSLSDISKNVNIENSKYNLTNGELKSGYPLGVSNEFIKKNTKISVKDGTLLIIFGNNIKYTINSFGGNNG